MHVNNRNGWFFVIESLHLNEKDRMIISIPHERYGEAMMARGKINEGVEITEQELIDYCKFVEECPKTVTGKIRKVEMHQQSIKELGLEHLVNN